MEKIILERIIVEKNKVEFEYNIPEKLRVFFNEKINFFYEYPEQYDLSEVPVSVLVIPFVMNLMPLIWISNALLIVDALDNAFYISLNEVLVGFQKVHPDVHFGGKLIVNQLVKNEYIPNIEKKVLLFSGGVDAISTLISHIDEKPMLINVWGADVHPYDTKNHKVIKRDLDKISMEMGLSFFVIRSSIRWCFNESYLSDYYRDTICDTWWHGMQHSVGLLSLLAPYDYLEKISTNYIASSYTEKHIGIVRCISYPFVDSKLKIVSTQCYHDGFELGRLDKIKNIVNFANELAHSQEIPMKVCFRPKNGKNCCKCEKCLRTMSVILAMGSPLERFGFYPDYHNPEQYIKKFCDRNILSEDVLSYWMDTSCYVKENGLSGFKMYWIADYQFNTFKSKWYSPFETSVRICLGKFRKILFEVRRRLILLSK